MGQKMPPGRARLRFVHDCDDDVPFDTFDTPANVNLWLDTVQMWVIPDVIHWVRSNLASQVRTRRLLPTEFRLHRQARSQSGVKNSSIPERLFITK